MDPTVVQRVCHFVHRHLKRSSTGLGLRLFQHAYFQFDSYSLKQAAGGDVYKNARLKPLMVLGVLACNRRAWPVDAAGRPA